MAKVGNIIPTARRETGINGFSSPQTTNNSLADSRLLERLNSNLTFEKVREMRDDPTISFMREVILAPPIHTEWTIIEGKDAPEGARDFIEDFILPRRLALLQTSFFGCLDFGWMPYEKVVDEKDGNLVFTKIKSLLQDYTYVLIYENTGDFAGYWNSPSAGTFSTSVRDVELTEDESLHIVLEKEGDNWYGRSVSQIVKKTYEQYLDVNNSVNRYDKKVAGSHWIIYFPVGKSEYKGTVKSNHEIALALLDRLEANGAIAIPDEIKETVDDLNDSLDRKIKGKWRVELLSDKGNSSENFINRLKYLDTLKVRAFGVPERSVLEGKFGTKAEAETHADIGLGTIDIKHRIIVQQYNEQLVNPLLRLNYGEKAVNKVKVVVAPLVDSRLAILRDTYRLLLQNPESLIEEAAYLDRSSIRDELGLQSVSDEEAEAILESREEKAEAKMEREKDREFKTAEQERKERESLNG